MAMTVDGALAPLKKVIKNLHRSIAQSDTEAKVAICERTAAEKTITASDQKLEKCDLDRLKAEKIIKKLEELIS